MRYNAFLSYRSSDKALAARIFDRLERWRTPGGVVGKAGRFGPIPRHAGPICRDREEFPTAAYVDTVIAEKIAASKHLIVLCTPAAAEAESWVAREIALFRRLRPDGEIHAIIGAGAPPSCFPEALLSRDEQGRLQAPLAADMRKAGDGPDRAIVKLIAGLIGAEFDLLWRRERRRRVRNGLILSVAALAVALGAYGVSRVQETRIAAQRDQIESLQPERQEAAFRTFYEFMQSDGGPPVRLQYQIVLSLDLNGDGRLDFVVYDTTPGTCGSGGCYSEVYESAGGAFVPAGTMFARSDIRPLPQRRVGGRISLVSEGWSNLNGDPLYHVHD